MKSLPPDWQRVVCDPVRAGWFAFFDWLEEQNDQQRLQGYRALYAEWKTPMAWCASGEVTSLPPVFARRDVRWVWMHTPPSCTPEWTCFKYRLPDLWFREVRGRSIAGVPGWREYKTQFAALDAAAVAYPI